MIASSWGTEQTTHVILTFKNRFLINAFNNSFLKSLIYNLFP